MVCAQRLQQVEDEVKLQLSEQTELLLDSREGLMAINNSVVDCLDDRLKRLEEKNSAMEATVLATGEPTNWPISIEIYRFLV